MERNSNFERLKPSYLFRDMQEIAARYDNLVDLSIGDTSLPIPENIGEAMAQKARSLTTPEQYQGYGKGQGNEELRELIAKNYQMSAEEIFISDGAKSDLGRIQLLFGKRVSIAVQDPTYPVYVDTSRLVGQSELIYLPCTEENGFFPQLRRADLIYFCSPNNPTGHAASFKQLQELVHFARENGSIIIFDAAYSAFIQDELPRSIYEIPGAKEVAIEVSSFSKSFGFTGVRLGWSVVPKALRYTCGRPIHPDFLRIATTFFNGASCVAEAGGIEAIKSDPTPLVRYYKENAALLLEALSSMPTVGGVHAPYLFVRFGEDSWQEFEKLLEETGILTIPGSGFGSSGEGFLRFSALAKRSSVEEACHRLQKYLCSTC